MKKPYRALANQIDSILRMSVSMSAQDQMLEIVFKDSSLMVSQDIPPDTVTTKYHDEIVADAEKEYLRKLRAQGKSHREEIQRFQETLNKWKRMRDASVVNSNQQFDLREKAESALLDAQIEIGELTALLDERTKPKAADPYDSDATELEKLGDAIHEAQKTKEIKHILQNAMVKGLVQTPEEKAKADADFDRVRMTKFYTDKELQIIDKMPKFPGHSLIKGNWIYIKQPPLNQLAADEIPFLNLRPKRGKKCNLNKNEVWQLRRYIKSGRRNNWIEERMGLSSAAVSQAKTGRTYKKVPSEPKVKQEEVTAHAGYGIISQK